MTLAFSERRDIRSVPLIADLQAFTDMRNAEVVATTGYLSPGVGAGHYRFVLGDTTAVDGIFVLSGVGGRWHLTDKHEANLYQAGAVGDGVADDTQAFKNAVATGVTVRVPKGIFLIKDAIEFGADFRMLGDGPGRCEVRWDAATSSQVMFKNNATVNTLEVRDICFRHRADATASFTDGGAILTNSGKSIIIDNCSFIDMSTTCLELLGTDDAVVREDCRVTNCRAWNETAGYTSANFCKPSSGRIVQFHRNYIRNYARPISLEMKNNRSFDSFSCTENIIEESKVANVSSTQTPVGIHVSLETGTQSIENCVITDNIIRNTNGITGTSAAGYAIGLNCSANTIKHATIANNIIDTWSGITSASIPIFCKGVENPVVTGNQMANITWSAANYRGMVIQTYQHGIVTGNLFQGTSYSAPIVLLGNLQDCKLEGNYCDGFLVQHLQAPANTAWVALPTGVVNPDVSGVVYGKLTNGSLQNVTSLNNGVDGQWLRLWVSNNNTILVNGSSLKLAGGKDFRAGSSGGFLNLVNDNGTWYEVSRATQLTVATSYQLANVAALTNIINPVDGDVATTIGYTTAGIGAGTYRFKSGDSTTADAGFVITHASGRWHLLDKSRAIWTQWGCLGDGTTDDTARAQAALNSGATNLIDIGTFRITTTLTRTLSLSARAPSIIGIDPARSVILADIATAIPALELINWDSFALRNFEVRKAASPTTPGNFTGIRIADSQRWAIDNVHVKGASVGIAFDRPTAGSFLGSLANVGLRYCKTGFTADSWSSVSGEIQLENCTVKPYSILTAHNTHLTITDQSNQARTSASTIDNCLGCSFNIYGEDGAASTVPYLSVGATTYNYDCEFRGRLTQSSGSTARAVTFDKVFGGGSRLAFAAGGFMDNVATTSNTRNFRITTAPDLSTWPASVTDVPILVPARYSEAPPVNYGPDPFLNYGQPGTLSRAMTTASASTAAETTIKPDFAAASMKVTASNGVSNTACFARWRLATADFPHLLDLRGRLIGVGCWMYVPTNHPCGDGGSGGANIGPYFTAGGDTGAAGTANTAKKRKGEWYFTAVEFVLDAAAAQIVCDFYAQGQTSSFSTDANTLAYFTAPVVWVGGFTNDDKISQGLFSYHPQAGNPFHRVGAGTPEGAAYAPIGTVWSRTDGGSGTSYYVKESGNQSNTLWVAK